MKKLLTTLIIAAVLGGLVLSGCKKEEPASPAESQQLQENRLPAPQFTLTDTDGKTHSLSDYLGKIVVLEWTNSDCPFVKRHYNANTMVELADKYVPKGIVWLAINSSHYADTDFNIATIEEYGLVYPVLDDSNGDVGRLYGAKTTPHMFIVDAQGNIAYQGAIDDNPSGDKSEVVNYVEKALDELLAGEEVAIATTKAYGCTVKYGN